MSNQKETIAKLVKLFTEQQSLNEDIKQVKDDAKSSGLDPAILSNVAKAIVNNEVDKLLAKSESTIEAVNVSRS